MICSEPELILGFNRFQYNASMTAAQTLLKEAMRFVMDSISKDTIALAPDVRIKTFNCSDTNLFLNKLISSQKNSYHILHGSIVTSDNSYQYTLQRKRKAVACDCAPYAQEKRHGRSCSVILISVGKTGVGGIQASSAKTNEVRASLNQDLQQLRSMETKLNSVKAQVPSCHFQKQCDTGNQKYHSDAGSNR